MFVDRGKEVKVGRVGLLKVAALLSDGPNLKRHALPEEAAHSQQHYSPRPWIMHLIISSLSIRFQSFTLLVVFSVVSIMV